MRLLVSSDQVEYGDGEALPPSVIKILDGALDAIATQGIKRLSMSDIIEFSGVSRATLYRYFSNREEVLAAVSEFVCVSFENGIREVGSEMSDPMERFRAVMKFFARFTIERSPERIFEVEPTFHLDFFRSHFERHNSAVRDALDPVFDHLESLMAERFDRASFVETLVRTQLSTLLVPASNEWIASWNEIPSNVEKWALRIASAYKISKKG